MTRQQIFVFVVGILLVFGVTRAHEEGEEEEKTAPRVEVVTCGSLIKLKHVSSGFRLHSHQVTYGSGSGQQSVTGFPEYDDPNSLWYVRGSSPSSHCPQGRVVRMGDTIRLQHYSTQRNLHSHLHQSPLTHGQEVSCYGEGGNGDTGDKFR